MEKFECEISKLIKLKFEDNNKTVLYINNEKLKRIYYSTVQLPGDKIVTNYNSLNSLDKPRKVENTHFMRFKTHCFNLTRWFEKGYDIKYLHYSVAYPILKRLSELGEENIYSKFKNEISRGIKNYNFKIVDFLMRGNYTKYLQQDELELIFINEIENGNLAVIHGLIEFNHHAYLKKILNCLSNENSKSRINIHKAHKKGISNLQNALDILRNLINLNYQEAREILREELVNIIKNGNIESVKYCIGLNFYFKYIQENDLKQLMLENTPKLTQNIFDSFIIDDYNELNLWSIKLLRKLIKIGDPIAKKVYINELRTQICKQSSTYVRFLYNNNLLNNLTDKDLKNLFKDLQVKELNLGYDYFNQKDCRFLFKYLRYFKSIDILRLDDNGFKIFPDFIGNLTSLQELHLNDNIIQKIPNNIIQLSSLKVLNLRDNKLEKYPEVINQLKSLRKLDLSLNNIKRLSPNIGNLKNLTELNLKSTLIANLPDSIENLTSLQILNLRSTRIKKLPETIGKLYSLEELYLEGSAMELPESLKNLTSLRFLGYNEKHTEKYLDQKSLSIVKYLRKKGAFYPIDNL